MASCSSVSGLRTPNRTPYHNGRRACPQSDHRLQEYINKGLAEFTPVVEVIRLLYRDQMYQTQLMTDFISFRDVTAHKCVKGVCYRQMIAAFVQFLREIVGLPEVSAETTKFLKGLKFARMADINFVVCATWFVKMLDNAQLKANSRQVEILRKNLENYSTHSSFSGYKFTCVQPDTISVSHNGRTSQLIDTLLGEFAEKLKTTACYSQDQIIVFTKLYKEAAAIAMTGTNHTAVLDVLKQLEGPCNCTPPKSDNDAADTAMAESTPKAVQGVPVQITRESECTFFSTDDLADKVEQVKFE